jgi:general secretion pathway protein E
MTQLLNQQIIREPLGQILLRQAKLDTSTLERALRIQKEGANNEKLGSLLVTLGMVSSRDVATALAEQLGFAFVEAAQFPEMPILEERVSARFLQEHKALPLREDDNVLELAMAEPNDAYAIKAFEMVTGRRVRPVLGVPADIDAAVERLYVTGRGGAVDAEIRLDGEDFNADVQQLKDLASEAPVIRMVSQIIAKALDVRASDIHIEPFENQLKIRYRIDGVMHEQEAPPKRLSAAVISRVKILANLDIAERRLPQDGRIRLRVQGKEVDFRVSTVPTMHGESVVMRILDKKGVVLDFDRLGFGHGPLMAKFQLALKQPNGILLVTGPTGSGKTTTLYTALDQLNQPDVKILTVEDPVEYQMAGINQIQVKPQIDLTFATALRSIVRQDPDVIMIGEIRDLETAQIAVQSALTGHLVLSTLHTNDAPSSVNRLLDMGVEDYLLTSTVIGILAQRLVRTLCVHCREAYTPLPEVAKEMDLARHAPAGSLLQLYKPIGCAQCGGTGYTGRVSILEMMPMTDRIRPLVMRHANAAELRHAAIADGMEPMFDDGVRKALAGTTTLEEVVRATREG